MVITRLNLWSSSIMHKYPRSFLTFPAIGGFPFCSIYPPEPQALSRIPRSFHFLSRRLLEEGRPASCMKHPAYRADIIPDPKLVSTHGPEGTLQTRDRVRLTSVIHMAPSNRPRAMSPSRLHMGSCGRSASPPLPTQQTLAEHTSLENIIEDHHDSG